MQIPRPDEASRGIFGRMDAAFAAIEAQKKGDLHVHTQLFVQCLHQHKQLDEVMEQLRPKSGDDPVKRYFAYKTHV